MSITTRTGDNGETGLLFSRRTSKDDPRIAACGDVDELNAAIGLARAHLHGTSENSRLEAIQKSLIALMGELATLPEDSARYASSKFDKLAAGDIQQLDSWIAEHEASGLAFEGWALPGGTIASAHLDMARTICRRAERSTVAIRSPVTNGSSQAVVYLNRLSDLLWLMARSVEQSPESSQLA
ncbi:MAG TPA: cob(I)yrinic acid a,c-diamide adenosyltransferase [Verrucomicrobiales bacterium]|nr:cob(I)yrinic acid a,c-diamide adenosyltransferase [Verrucomicrobiales bacterium]